MAEELTFAASSAAMLEPHLPPPTAATPPSRIFVTLTFATSLDSSLSLAPGVRTRLSGPESKAMTHFLRSRHSAILIGVSTMLADDPGLNCRIAGVQSQPRPVIIDPHLRWTPSQTDKVLQTCRAGLGLAPYVITAVQEGDIPRGNKDTLEEHGGKYIHVQPTTGKASHADGAATPEGNAAADVRRARFAWQHILSALHSQGLPSVMVEGGGQIINSLLDPCYHSLVDSVIVTIAPTWLGKGGVVVSPDRVYDEATASPAAAARLTDVSWHPFGQDVVMCGRLHG